MRRFLLLVLSCASLSVILSWTLFPPPAAWIDAVYTPHLYAGLARGLVPLTGALPFSLAGVLGVVGLLWLGVTLFRSSPRVGRGAFFRHWTLRAALSGVTLAALFTLMWGANYGRTPLETRYGFADEPTQAAEVEHLARELLAVMQRDAPTGAPPDNAWEQGLAEGRASLGRLVSELEGRTVTLPQHVKRTPPGLLIFTGQPTGIVSPWTLEAHIDGALPLPYALGTALHEMTHLAGYGSEAETDFIAGLAGLSASDPYLRYSTALTLFSRVSQALARETYRDLYADLPERAREDIGALRAVYARYRPPSVAAWVQTLFYDTYLRSQGVGAGVADYDRATDLLVAARRAEMLEFSEAAFEVLGPEGSQLR